MPHSWFGLSSAGYQPSPQNNDDYTLTQNSLGTEDSVRRVERQLRLCTCVHCQVEPQKREDNEPLLFS